MLFLVASASVYSQQLNPARWNFSVENVTSETADLCFTVSLDPDWHIYSTRTDPNGPLPTEFAFSPSTSYQLKGSIQEPKPHEEFDELFNVTVRSFSGQATFRQTIRRATAEPFSVSGTLSYQLCNNGSCIPPDDFPFSFSVPEASKPATTTAVKPETPNPTTQQVSASASQDASGILDTLSALDVSQPESIDDSGVAFAEVVQPTDADAPAGRQSLWMAFLLALVGGLLTMITPCVFPMVPMTVNYFVHEGKRREAWVFGISIILIFAVLGAILTLFFGPEALYFLGTHWLPNLIFFFVFLAFSLSFFGLFEITLPSSWVNRSDARADKGGWLAPFFMALTTVLVSFSCTGPILGAALVGLATSTTNALVSLVTMLGFGIGFAAPFTLLALFPSWLKGLKSGSWLDTVKVTFAFLELAFGLKFLSMADLYCGWHLLDREIYLSLWIVIFALLGFFLLGKIRFKDQPEVRHVGVARLFLAILDFAFVLYMIPGLWGAPLKGISGFLPPMETQDFNIEKIVYQAPVAASSSEAASPSAARKYSDRLSLPIGFQGYFDLEEARAESRRTGKPIFIDFTGKTCANCREMEHYVWTDPVVRQMLNDNFVICALFADENTITLPQSEWITTSDGRQIKTLGRRNLYLQKTLYNMNAQPYYVITDADGNTLTRQNYQYDRNPRHFEAWLQEALGKAASSKL